MKYLYYIVLIVILSSCYTATDYSYIGTIGSRYGVDPFLLKEEWVELVDKISMQSEKSLEPAILWVIGSYKSGEIIMNFPGVDEKNIQYSYLDLNEKYLSYFDESDLNVFLLVEPGFAPMNKVIETVIENYSNHKSVKGICIDLEWYRSDDKKPFGESVTSDTIKTWIEEIKLYESKYQLLIMHWDLDKIEFYNHEDIIYLQNMEGVNSVSELTQRHTLWSRYFYPGRIGLILGADKENPLFSEFVNPLVDITETLDSLTETESSFFWTEPLLNRF